LAAERRTWCAGMASNRRPCGFQPGWPHPGPSGTIRLSDSRPAQEGWRGTCHPRWSGSVRPRADSFGRTPAESQGSAASGSTGRGTWPPSVRSLDTAAARRRQALMRPADADEGISWQCSWFLRERPRKGSYKEVRHEANPAYRHCRPTRLGAELCPGRLPQEQREQGRRRRIPAGPY
jgi:hypothetical protein